MRKKSIFSLDPDQLERLFSVGTGDSDPIEEQKSQTNTNEVGKSREDPARKKDHPHRERDLSGNATASLVDMERPGSQIGRYKLLHVLGEGGMGIVYLAQQKHPIRRQVALKVIKPGMDSKRIIARFEAERQALALLDHPNIAHVHDAGTTESGRPYFVMEYVKGLSIIEHCDRHKLTIEERLKLFQQVCLAVHHAHQKGIIHRDIKPSNILVSTEDDKATPKIIDFGVAKALAQPLTERTLATEDSQLLGTPEYMSPEQADMASVDIDTRSDIYSLGVLLYVLLTGVLPFDSTTFRKGGIEHIRQVIRETDPMTPSTRLTSLGEEAQKVAESRRTEIHSLAKHLKKELEWIPLKAMRKDRSERYRSASELADDIENYLNGVPLFAGPETMVYLIRKFVKRKRALVTGIVAVLAVLFAGILVSTLFAIDQSRARSEAQRAQKAEQEQRKLAEQQAEEYRRSLYVNRINLADKYYLDNNIGHVRDLLRACPQDLRGWEWCYLWRISDQARMTIRGHKQEVLSIALSPDGRRIVSGSLDATIKVWDSDSGSGLMTLQGHGSGVMSVAFSPDSRRIVSGSADRTIKVWDADNGNELMTLQGHEDSVWSVAFSPDGRRIVSGSADRTIKVWDAENGNELMTFRGHEGVVRAVAFNPHGRRIVSGSLDGTLKIWDADSGNELMSIQGQKNQIYTVTFSPKGKRIVSGSWGIIKVWDAETGSELMAWLAHGGPVRSLAFSKDSGLIVSGGWDSTLRVWDAESGSELMTFRGHEGAVDGVAFSPNGKWIVSGSEDGTIKLWDDYSGGKPMNLQGHENGVGSAEFSSDGRRIVSGGKDMTLKVWNANSGIELMTLRGHKDEVWSAALSPDGRRIVSGSLDATIKVWDSDSGSGLMTLQGHGSGVMSVAFSPDGRRIVSGSADRTIKVWDADNGSELMTLQGHEGSVWSVAFSPDSRRIVSGSADRTIKVWDAENGNELMTLRGHEGRVESVVFSPDGRWIVSGSKDNTLKLWDVESGTELMTLRGHVTYARSLAFSPNGRRIVSGSSDGTIKLWDVESGSELTTLRGYKGQVLSVAFSPDGQRIVSGGLGDNMLKVWNIADPEKVTAEME